MLDCRIVRDCRRATPIEIRENPQGERAAEIVGAGFEGRPQTPTCMPCKGPSSSSRISTTLRGLELVDAQRRFEQLRGRAVTSGCVVETLDVLLKARSAKSDSGRKVRFADPAIVTDSAQHVTRVRVKPPQRFGNFVCEADLERENAFDPPLISSASRRLVIICGASEPA